MRTRRTKRKLMVGILAAGLFLGVLFLIQFSADRLMLAVANWLFRSN
jgi:uncharacterized membrane protein